MKRLLIFVSLIFCLAGKIHGQGLPRDGYFLSEYGGIKIYYTLFHVGGPLDLYNVMYYFHNSTLDKLSISDVYLNRAAGKSLMFTKRTIEPNGVATYSANSVTYPVPTVSFKLTNVTQQEQKAAQLQQIEQQKLQTEEQKKEAREAQSAIVNFTVDVGATIMFDGENMGVCQANVLFRVQAYKTGDNVQHLVEVIPLASESAKQKEIIILTPGSVIYKEYTFMNKIGNLEKQRIAKIKDDERKSVE